MTRYYVNISPALVTAIESRECKLPDGWRLIERWRPRYRDTECWIVEDDYAGKEFEDYLVMPSFMMVLIGNGPDYTVEVSEREIRQQRY